MSTHNPDEKPPAERDVAQSDGPIVDARRAKQGRSGLRIFTVLTISLALAVIVMAVILAVRSPGLEDAEQTVDARPVPAELQPVPEKSDAGAAVPEASAETTLSAD